MERILMMLILISPVSLLLLTSTGARKKAKMNIITTVLMDQRHSQNVAFAKKIASFPGKAKTTVRIPITGPPGVSFW